MLQMNNFVEVDGNVSMNMMSTPEDSPSASPTETGGKKSLLPKANTAAGKFETVVNSESVFNNRISDLHSQ